MPDREFPSLDGDQEAAMTPPPSSRTAVIAGAGAGKTSVFVARALYVRKYAENRSGTVLCLSYTNKASEEIGGRLLSLMGRPRIAGSFDRLSAQSPGIRTRFWNGTLHSFAKHVIEEVTSPAVWRRMASRDRDRLEGVSELYERFVKAGGVVRGILDEREASSLWEETVVSDPHLGHAFHKNWKRKREDVCGVWSGRQAAQMIGHMVPVPIPHMTEAQARSRRWHHFDITEMEQHAAVLYQIAKMSSGRIDYNDLLSLAAAALTYIKDLRDYYRSGLAHVLVDEAQDITFLDYVFLKSLPCFLPDGDDAVGYTLIGDCQPAGTQVRTPTGTKSIEDIRKNDLVVSYSLPHRFVRSAGRAVLGVSSRHHRGTLIKVTCDGKVSRYTPEHKCLANFKPLSGKYIVYMMRRGNQFRIGKSRIGHECGAAGLGVRMGNEKAEAGWILAAYDTNVEASIMEQAISGKYGITQLTFEVQGGRDTRLLSTVREAWRFMGSNRDRALACLKDFGREIECPLYTGLKYFSMKRPSVVHACNLLEGVLMLPQTDTTKPHSSDWRAASIEKEEYNGEVYSLDVEEDHSYFADGIATHNCRQEIFDFRSGQPGLFADLIGNGWADSVRYLSTNYRSGAEIVSLASRVAQNPLLHTAYESDPAVVMRAAPGAAPSDVSWTVLGRGEEVMDYLPEVVRRSLAGPHGSRAMLVRNNWMKRDVEEVLAGVAGARERFDVSTIHSAKGREWDHVILTGLARDKFPTRPGFWRTPEENLRSESRLLYVALTRARRSLEVFEAENGVFHPSVFPEDVRR